MRIRRHRLISSAAESTGQGVGGVPVEVVPGAVVAAGSAGVGVAGEVLHVAERDAGVQCGGDLAYLPWILRSAWWDTVLAIEARGSWRLRHVGHVRYVGESRTRISAARYLGPPARSSSPERREGSVLG